MNLKFNDKLKEALSVIGFILSILGATGYIITILVLVYGTTLIDFQLLGKDGIFFLINISFGLFIRSGFYVQGVSYAKQENKEVLTEYYNKKVSREKEKRNQSFEFKMAMEITRTTAIQVLIFLVSGMGLIYLAGFEGMNNTVYLWNGISNLFMFTGFGFLALSSSYDKYIQLKIPRIKENIRKLDEKKLIDEELERNKVEEVKEVKEKEMTAHDLIMLSQAR